MRENIENACYVNHLVAEHRRVHKMLKQTRAAIVRSVQPDNRPSFTNIAAVLNKLRQELSAHFREEEEGGCLEEAVTLCPSLTVEEHRIKAEHSEILAELDGLIGECEREQPTVQNQHAIQVRFDGWYQRLLAHEAAENRLVSQAFGTVANGEDKEDTPLIYEV